MATHQCPFCSKRLKTARGVTQCIFQTPTCRTAHINSISASQVAEPEIPGDTASEDDGDGLRRSTRVRKARKTNADSHRKTTGSRTTESTDREPNVENESSETERQVVDFDSDTTMDTNDESVGSRSVTPNAAVLERFVACCDGHSHNFLDLTDADKTSIKMMDILKRNRAPLNAYQELLTWHLKETGHLRAHETLSDTPLCVHRKTLIDRLTKRHNMSDMMPTIKKVTLPSSKARVSIPCRQAADVITHLLTNPDVEDSDYLFFQDDPLAAPPKNLTYIADLNTGDAYLKSYQRKITKKNQVLLAVPLYIDGATTGQFSDLPITALKASLGIHNRKARDKERSWLELGWIPEVRKQTARGKKLFKETGHLESFDVMVEDGEGDTGASKTDV